LVAASRQCTVLLSFSPGNFWPRTIWPLSPTHPTFLYFPSGS
jgi:hypothetical protein